jgi:hypothetical protein
MDKNFRVAARPENMSPCLKLEPKLAMIVDFAIVGNDDASIFVRQRLRTAMEVDNTQSDVRESDVGTNVETVTVRAAVFDRSRHSAERLDAYSSWVASRNAGYPAHCAAESVSERKNDWVIGRRGQSGIYGRAALAIRQRPEVQAWHPIFAP